MQAITGHLRRFKRGKRGMSNVIVAMLSLVLVVIVVGNVVLWSYQMNQVDWEKMQERINIVDAESLVANWTQNPSAYALNGGTTLVSGTTSNLVSDDGNYMTFRSYYSPEGTSDYVDNNLSNVDSSQDKGTHTNFTAQQYEPDLICDTLTEENTGGGSASFGSSSSTTYSTVTANYLYGSVFTSPADAGGATLQSITWYGRGASVSGNAKAVLVLHSTLAIIAVSNVVAFTTTAAERTCTFASPPTISASTEYVLMMVFSVSTRFYYEAGSTNQGHQDTTNSYTTPTNPTDATHSTNRYRISATYDRADNYELDLEAQWTNADFDEANEWLVIYADDNSHSLDATGGYMAIGGNPNWGSVTGPISFWIKWDTLFGRPWGQHEDMEMRISGTNLVLDWGVAGSLTSVTSFTTSKWYFIAVTWDENTGDLFLYVGDENNAPTQDAYNNAWTDTVSNKGSTANNFMASKGGIEPTDGHGDDLRYWNTDRSLAAIQGDYNHQLLGSETSLRSYFKLNNNFYDWGPNDNDASGSGSYSFQADTAFGLSSETIRVDVWNGSTWVNVLSDLADGLNYYSISSYLTSQTLTIRFTGGTETGDTVQNQWRIDATLLYVWSDEYVSEVEFTGLSNVESWTQLNWTTNIGWTTGSVSVTIQLYNFTSGAYQTSGFGYAAYTSSATPNTDENSAQSTTVGTTDFRNATGYWKIKITGVKSGTTQFDFKADFIEFCEQNVNGALLTFENSGPLTAHIIAVWVSNSTSHQRYTVNLFINSGENLSQVCPEVCILDGNYTMKIVTERGNMAVLIGC